MLRDFQAPPPQNRPAFDRFGKDFQNVVFFLEMDGQDSHPGITGVPKFNHDIICQQGGEHDSGIIVVETRDSA